MFLRIEEIYTECAGMPLVQEVFPSIRRQVDYFNRHQYKESLQPSWLKPDGIVQTPSGVLINRNTNWRLGLSVRFNRSSTLAAGELICRLMHSDYDFQCLGFAFGFSDPKRSDLKLWENQRERKLPLHPEMGRLAWDIFFRELHPELNWAIPLRDKQRKSVFVERQ